VHAVLAYRAGHGLGQASVPAAADDQKIRAGRFGDQDRSGVALDPVRDLLLYPSCGCCNSRLCAAAAELGSLRSGGHRVHARAVRWWSRDYQRTASGFPGYLTAMTSTGWIEGSLASNSAAILPSASGIGPLRCAARASSVSKVSKIP